MLWILLTCAAAPLQVARNAFQRGLVGDAGPWGATLVRFLFGLPFALVLWGITAGLSPGAAAHWTPRFWIAVSLGALAQVGATAALLVAMRRSGFAVATFMEKSSLPLGALIGAFVLGDRLGGQQGIGIALTTAGLAVLSWPRAELSRDAAQGGLFGLASGAAFAISLNAFRQASLALDPHHPIFAAIGAVVTAQTLQTLGLGAALAVLRPQALRAVAGAWRASLGAGACGAAASACWFSALALAPAGAVRAVAVIETPIAAAVGRRLFQESLTPRQIAAGVAMAVGVVLTALG